MKNEALYRGAQFVLSAPGLAELPPDTGAEAAFAGRSNVGKSSVLNTLTDNKKLARTSGTPGRTQMINLFRVTDEARLVDLPGFGYAKVPEAMRRRWQQVLPEYLSTRRSLAGVVLIMDVRHAPAELDLRMLEWCAHAGLTVHGVLTKADKLKRGAARRRLNDVATTLGKLPDMPPSLTLQLFSAVTGEGVEELRTVLDRWLGLLTETAESPDATDGTL